MQIRRLFIFSIFAPAIFCGCGQQTPIRSYETDVEEDKVVTSEVLRRSMAIPFDWSAPSEWKRAANDQFSTIAWEIDSSSKTTPRITVSSVRMGMGLQSQVVRWRGQIEAPEAENPMDGTETLDLDGTSATWVDLTGSKESILGLMLPKNGQLWVFKFRAANRDISKHRKAFRAFCESVRVTSG